MKRGIKFEKIFDAFHNKVGAAADTYRFSEQSLSRPPARRPLPSVYSLAHRPPPALNPRPHPVREGTRIEKTDTPEDLDMEDDEQIDAIAQQVRTNLHVRSCAFYRPPFFTYTRPSPPPSRLRTLADRRPVDVFSRGVACLRTFCKTYRFFPTSPRTPKPHPRPPR